MRCKSVILHGTSNPNKSRRAKFDLLTQQNDNTRQYSNQRASAEAGWQDEGLGVAGEDGVFAVAGADSDGQRVGAAQRGEAIVVYLNGKEVNILVQTAESLSDHTDAGCTVYRGRQRCCCWVGGF